MKKILICGGHLTPAIALIEELQHKNVQLFLFTKQSSTEGSKKISAELKEAQKYDVKIITIINGRLQRKFTRYTIPSLLKIPISFIQTFVFLLLIRPNSIAAVGGALSLPVVFNAWLIGIPTIIHEQAIEPGISNRLNALFAGQIFVTWPQTLKFFQKDKTKLVGNLVRPSLKLHSNNQHLIKFTKSQKDLVLITGGNQGSHFLNNLIFVNIDMFSDYKVVHLLGNANYKNDHEKASKINASNYLALDYLTASDMAYLYSRAKIVISRSGANTIWDLATFANVSILIPLPIAAGNEQFKNAQILKEAGSAIVINQQDCDNAKFKTTFDYLEKNHNQFKKSAQTFQKSLHQGGYKEVASRLLALV